MTGFLLKGILRDRSRSLFPFLTVAIGVALTVFLDAYLRGVQDSIFDATARFITGHLKVTTRAMAQAGGSGSNELALIDVSNLRKKLEQSYPSLNWSERIRFSGLIDLPDSTGLKSIQVPITGLAVDLAEENIERRLLRLEKALIRGRLPQTPNQVLLSEELAQQLQIAPGAHLTLLSATMNGGMAIGDFVLSGTIRFGVTAMDRGLIIVRIDGVRPFLEMEDAATEIVGFFKDGIYQDRPAVLLAREFNRRERNPGDEFSPYMEALRDASGLSSVIDIISIATGLITAIFILSMAVVLWNAGLMNSLRRYGEIGIRLALGESKFAVYRSLLIEAFFIGIFGAVVGTLVGLGFGFYLEKVGLNIGGMMKNATVVIDDVIRARIAPQSFVIGFLPGVGAIVIGTAISGVGVFRRQTAQLAKEFSE